jgi:16S rRNA processing protein RimM
MKERDVLPIGLVTRPQGIRGEIRVHLLGADPRQFLALQEIFTGPHPGELTLQRIVHIQPRKGLFILDLQGFTMENALACVGQFIWISRDRLSPLEEGEYYWADLVGLRVETVDGGEELGIVKGLLETGSNEVLVCERADQETLIPFIEEVVLQVDLDEGKILVRPTAEWM